MNAVSQRNTLKIVVANRVGGKLIRLNVRTDFKKSFLSTDMCSLRGCPLGNVLIMPRHSVIHSNCSRKHAVKTIQGSSRVSPTFYLT